MSFQGDVRGIGLAELLQGLARGQKDGTLTLSTRTGLVGRLGLVDGQAVLLPNSDDDAEYWRQRARDAWAAAGEEQAEGLRMEEIAHAERMEGLYRLLDGEGVHFRFEPDEKVPEGGQPFSIEFLLLEYARIGDELAAMPTVRDLPKEVVPVLLDPDGALQAGCSQEVIGQCEGSSTLGELADRLGWPMRQLKLALGPALASGAARVAHATEMLALGLGELQRKLHNRAARRLEYWCRFGPAGPLPPEVADRLTDEWIGGRLPAALKSMAPRWRRCLIRRLDTSVGNPSQAVVQWMEVSRLDRTDRIAKLKRMVAEFREGSNPDRPSVRELLDLSRDFRDAGNPRRAGPVLVIAASLQPASVPLQMELGIGLLAAGRPAEAGPWLLTGASELVEQGHADRALTPLRALLEAEPRNRECRQLLARARRESTSVKRLRRAVLGTVALAVLVGAGAVVKLRHDARYQERLAEVRALIKNPVIAKAKLEEYFGDVDGIETRELRTQIREHEMMIEEGLRAQWVAAYQEVKVECNRGDAVAAIERIRSLPAPPVLKLVHQPWPETKDLYTELADRLVAELEALGPVTEDSPQQVHKENVLDEQAEAVIVTLLAGESGAVRAMMVERMEELRDAVAARQDERAEITAARIREENLDRQDELLQMAESHERNGDFQRALQCFEEILSMDDSGRIHRVLNKRIDAVRTKHETVLRSRELAGEGRHEEAIADLQEVFQNPEIFMLPWHVESYPSGARVETSNGRRYTTPFDVESTLREEMVLEFTAEGYEPRSIAVDRPADRLVYLSRTSERSWAGRGRIDAIPVSVGDDHVVVSRLGEMACIGADGELVWSLEVKTLSGIARAPVFLPHRSGHLLLVTEDGEAWIVEAETGHLEGPWNLNAAPTVGPAPIGGHVGVLLSGGRLVEWSDALRPERDVPATGEEIDGEYRYGSSSGSQVARRRSGDLGRLACRWNEWVVEVQAEAYLVYNEGAAEEGYSVLRDGDWEFLAWEAPSARAPRGRLWISDGGGLRSFVPLSPRAR